MSDVTENQPDGTPTSIDLGVPDLERAMGSTAGDCDGTARRITDAGGTLVQALSPAS